MLKSIHYLPVEAADGDGEEVDQIVSWAVRILAFLKACVDLYSISRELGEGHQNSIVHIWAFVQDPGELEPKPFVKLSK